MFSMLLNTLVFSFLLHLISCEEKKICITKDTSVDSLQCSSKIEGVISGSDLTQDISSYLNNLDTDVTLYLIGSNIEFNFKLNIFNNKKLTIQFDSASSGAFDVSEIDNIDMRLKFSGFTSIYPTVNLKGSTLNNDKTSITLEKISLKADFSEIQLMNFSTKDSTFSFTKFTTNSLYIDAKTETNIILKDNSAICDSQTFYFLGENPLISITLSSNRQLVIDNQASNNNLIPSLLLQTTQKVTFKGNDFSQSNTISFKDCPTIITEIGLLPITSFSFSGSSSNDINLNVNKALTIKGTLPLLSSRDLIIKISGNTVSRVPIKIDSITLETGEIQLLSSWIDLTIDNFKFKSTSPPLIPCIGYGGSSTLTANHITLDGQTSLSFNSISIKLDFNEELTDNELPKLVNSQWNIITFKSFTNANTVSAFDPITFTPEGILGFGQTESNRIVSIKSTVSTDYTVTLTASSISALPYLICFKSRGSCLKGGKTISSLSNLSTAIPPEKKSVILIINKGFAEIDLSILPTTGAEFTIEYEQSIYSITSITMGDEFPNTKVDHLILNGISIGNGRGGESFLQLNSREISIIGCKNSSQTTITFNENSVVNIDQGSYDQLNYYISSFPQTNILTPIESASSFEISNDQYIFTGESNSVSYSKLKLPKAAFQIELASNNDYSLNYKTSATTIDSVDIKFISSPSQTFNPKITVTFQNLDLITSANKIGLDFGPFDSSNTVDFSVYQQSNYFKITGTNVNIIPDDTKPNGKICVCKATPCTSGCESDYTQVSYSEFQQNIQAYSGNSFRIIVVGDQDGSSPTLPISLIDKKDITIIGTGTNPKIQLDCSSEFSDEEKTIEFSKITVVHSTGNNLHISNLKLSEGTTIDSSFNSVPLTVSNLNCEVSNLAFSSVSVQKSLILSGDASNSEASAKVSFAQSSKFTYTLPKSVTFNGNSKLIINKLEFDLANVIPDFSLPDDSEDFTISGSSANIDSIGSNIELLQTSNLKSISITGTWTNQNPTKFIIFKDFKSDLHLASENIPISIEYSSFNNIELQQEKVGILGKVSLSSEAFGDYRISTTIANSVSTLTINELYVTYTSSGTVTIDFESSNINLNLNTLNLTSKFKIILFNMLIDLNHQNQVNIVNEFEQTRSQALKYKVKCTITESLNHPEMSDFIDNNHTLITVNSQNTIVLQNTIEFDERAPPGFDMTSFMLSNDDNKLTFYTVKSPIEGEIDLYYGNCADSCKGTQLKNENLASIDTVIPKNSTLVIIRFYESLPEGSVLNLDISGLSIEYLSLCSNSELRTVPAKFGKSVTNLDVDSISIKNDENDAFSIQKVKLSKGGSLSSNAILDNVQSLIIDKESIFTSNLNEFKNSLEVVLELQQPSELILSYTKTGMKVTNPQSKEFNIDVSKLSNVTLYVKSTETPQINLEKEVTELKQVQSLIFDSSLIHIGSNWGSLRATSPIVQYTIQPQETAVSVVTDSFPFEAWDLMYTYSIQFSDVLSPFTYSDEYDINGKKLSFSTYSPSTKKYNDVTFKEIVLSGESTVKAVATEDSDKSLIIEELKLAKDSTSKVINAHIKNEIILEPGSQLTDNFNLSEGFSEIEIEWDLNEVPLLSPSNLQNVVPEKVEIKYIGRSTEGRQQSFIDFLSKGVVLMKNIGSCDEILQKIHFKSETADEFDEESSTLSIECQCTDKNEVQLISKSTPIIVPTTTTSSSFATSSSLPITTSDNIPTENPTPSYPANGPTVDKTSYNLKTDSVVFTKDGYSGDGNTFSGNENDNQILFINTNSASLSASTTNDRPNNEFYLSPKAKNAKITITGTDFGNGEIGVHANSNNPSIILPQSKVPLKLYNDENSQVNLNVNGQPENSISLSKLLVNNGGVKFNMPSGVSSLNFDKVDVYNTGYIQSIFGQTQLETNINILDMKSGSTITLSNAKFGETVKSAPNSKLVIDGKSKFDENTNIRLTETSFIEFGNSIVEGVCGQIELMEVKLNSKSKHNSEESEVQLVCGSQFNCSSWLPKYSGDINYPSAKCINFKTNNEMCLVASSKPNQGSDGNNQKESLSAGAIAGICVACVVFAGLLIFVVVYCLKKNHDHHVLQYNEVREVDELDDNPSHI